MEYAEIVLLEFGYDRDSYEGKRENSRKLRSRNRTYRENYWEDPRTPFQISSMDNFNDVTLLESNLSRFCGFERVQRSNAGDN